LCILPYHRIVRKASTDAPLAVVRQSFDVTEVGAADETTVRAFEHGLWEDPAFGMVAAGRLYRLEVPADAAGEIPAGVLADRALAPLGVRSAEEGLSFTPDGVYVASEVAAGDAVCGFLIPPVSVERVWEHAAAGAKMPEKSTYFFPKPRDGIVIRPLGPC
jgi:uncharacterized protein (DUF1015 family)